MSRLRLVAGPLLVVALWYIAAAAVSSPIIPWPHDVAVLLVSEAGRGAVALHLLASLLRILAGTLLALIVAVPSGIAAANSRSGALLISPLLYLFYPVPKIAFLPVLMVLFGLGDLPKVILVAAILVFPLAMTVRDSTLALADEYFLLAKSLRLSRKLILKDIILPGIRGGIFSALRIGVGISLSVLFFAENFATRYGMGYYVMEGWVMADYKRMYAGIVILSLTGILLYNTIDWAGRKWMPWNKK